MPDLFQSFMTGYRGGQEMSEQAASKRAAAAYGSGNTEAASQELLGVGDLAGAQNYTQLGEAKNARTERDETGAAMQTAGDDPAARLRAAADVASRHGDATQFAAYQQQISQLDQNKLIQLQQYHEMIGAHLDELNTLPSDQARLQRAQQIVGQLPGMNDEQRNQTMMALDANHDGGLSQQEVNQFGQSLVPHAEAVRQAIQQRQFDTQVGLQREQIGVSRQQVEMQARMLTPEAAQYIGQRIRAGEHIQVPRNAMGAAVWNAAAEDAAIHGSNGEEDRFRGMQVHALGGSLNEAQRTLTTMSRAEDSAKRELELLRNAMTELQQNGGQSSSPAVNRILNHFREEAGMQPSASGLVRLNDLATTASSAISTVLQQGAQVTDASTERATAAINSAQSPEMMGTAIETLEQAMAQKRQAAQSAVEDANRQLRNTVNNDRFSAGLPDTVSVNGHAVNSITLRGNLAAVDNGDVTPADFRSHYGVTADQARSTLENARTSSSSSSSADTGSGNAYDASSEGGNQATPAQMQELYNARNNPRAMQSFDAHFGQGAASRAIQQYQSSLQSHGGQ